MHSEKIQTGEHFRRYNAHECNELAITMVNEDTECHRGIIFHRIDNQLKRISELNRS